MRSRLLTAAFGIPALLCVVTYLPPWTFGVLVAVMAGVGVIEFSSLARGHGLHPKQWLGAGLAGALAFAPALGWNRDGGLTAVAVLVIVAASLRHQDELRQVLPRAAVTALGVAWLGLLGGYLSALRVMGPAALLTLLLVVWGGDSAAYLAGRAFGRTRMSPRISPNKTVAGLVAALIAGVVALWVGERYFGLAAGLSPWSTLAFGGLLGGVAVVGDLAESALKRGAGMKDSGALFPGHGGVLDRLDSLLFAAPVMYHGLRWFSSL